MMKKCIQMNPTKMEDLMIITRREVSSGFLQYCSNIFFTDNFPSPRTHRYINLMNNYSNIVLDLYLYVNLVVESGEEYEDIIITVTTESPLPSSLFGKHFYRYIDRNTEKSFY